MSRANDIPEGPEGLKDFVRKMTPTYTIPEWVFQVIDVLVEYKDQCENLGTQGTSE